MGVGIDCWKEEKDAGCAAGTIQADTTIPAIVALTWVRDGFPGNLSALPAELPIVGYVGCAPVILPQNVTAGGRKIRATDSMSIATFVRRLSAFGPVKTTEMGILANRQRSELLCAHWKWWDKRRMGHQVIKKQWKHWAYSSAARGCAWRSAASVGGSHDEVKNSRSFPTHTHECWSFVPTANPPRSLLFHTTPFGRSAARRLF